MDIKPIRTKRDHEAALGEIEHLMTAKRNTPEGDRLDVLVTLVEAYEAKAVMQDVATYEETQETMALLEILALGTRQVEEGKVVPASQAGACAAGRLGAVRYEVILTEDATTCKRCWSAGCWGPEGKVSLCRTARKDPWLRKFMPGSSDHRPHRGGRRGCWAGAGGKRSFGNKGCQSDKFT